MTWVESVPEMATAPAYPHEALAAAARLYAGRWLAVPGMPPRYASDIVNGRMDAYRPVGSFAALYRDSTVFVSFTGSNRFGRFRSQVFPPIKFAVMDMEDIPDSVAGASASAEVGLEVAAQLRSRPGQWAIMPRGIVSAAWVIYLGITVPFAPQGAFQAADRGWDVYARYVGGRDLGHAAPKEL